MKSPKYLKHQLKYHRYFRDRYVPQVCVEGNSDNKMKKKKKQLKYKNNDLYQGSWNIPAHNFIQLDTSEHVMDREVNMGLKEVNTQIVAIVI